MVEPCDQNDPTKVGKANPIGYTNKKVTKKLTRVLMVIVDYISNLVWCEASSRG